MPIQVREFQIKNGSMISLDNIEPHQTREVGLIRWKVQVSAVEIE